MIKIFMSVRNRLAITQKAVEALRRFTKDVYHLYIYDNQTNYLVDEHFKYFSKLYKRGEIKQISFTTDESTFNAFSKASTCNFFGLQHMQDPNKNKYDFLVMMDNDIIVLPGWDKRAKLAWRGVKKNKLNNIKVIGQLPGGIKHRSPVNNIDGLDRAAQGKLGGSGFWIVKSNFFDEVGVLPLHQLVGHDKKHDQMYWNLLNKASNGQPYILGIRPKFGVHCGPCAGSVCNRLTRNKGNKHRLERIRFEDQEKNISSMTFDQFFKWITEENTSMIRGW